MGSRGPLSKYNPAEVVRIALTAYQQGRSMAVVVGSHYNIDPRTASTLISRLRRDGHNIPNQRGWNNGGGGFDLSYRSPCGTPGAYRRHVAAGQEPCAECKADKARRARLRRRNGTEARPEPEWDGPAVSFSSTGIRLMCETCGDWCDSVPKLTHHTLQVHHRPPTKNERTPR